jgi:hypothetical protein
MPTVTTVANYMQTSSPGTLQIYHDSQIGICSKQKNVYQTLQAEVDNDRSIAQLELSSDEANFHISGNFNRFNLRV